MSTSFFTTADDRWFQPTDHTRGPWHPEHCHAGPPSGLAARAIERLLPRQRLTRLTVDLIRPIPFAGFSVEAEVIREGRTASIARGSIVDANGKVCNYFSGLLMTPQPARTFPTQHADVGVPEEAEPGSFPITRILHDLPAFVGPGVETRYPPGESPEPGPTTVWMRTVPLLPDETPSAFQRICPLADCGNAFSRNAEPWELQFTNPDLTLMLHRDPQGEWLASRSASYWQADGIGCADAQLFDRHGCVGRALQTLLIRPHQ